VIYRRALEQDAGHRESHKGVTGCGALLEVTRQSTIAAGRTEGSRLYGLFPHRRYQLSMLARLAWILIAAATMSSARAADLGEVTPPVCDCGSNMITIYDFEPGVVTRNWTTDCECRYVPYARRFRKVAAAVDLIGNEPFVDPWRSW
jgi:hypothetical protein